MSLKPVDLTGGKSVYCFNQAQLDHAFAMYEHEDESGDKIRAELERIEKGMTRNERASLAFVIIDRLNQTSDAD